MKSSNSYSIGYPNKVFITIESKSSEITGDFVMKSKYVIGDGSNNIEEANKI